MSRKDDLYVLESPQLRRFKIGRSRDAAKRIASLQTGSPDPDLRLIVVLEGQGEQEDRVKKAWASCWSHGEWFDATDELRAWVCGGCDLDELPLQFKCNQEFDSNISCHHNPKHIDGLVDAIR